MASFQHYEDLRMVFARLNQVLPGRARLQHEKGGQEEGWDWKNTVIEAKPLSLHRLMIQSGVFHEILPSSHQTCQSRRWYVTNRTRVTTNDCPTGPPALLPAGISQWHASDQARRLMVLALHDAKNFFDDQTNDCTLPAHNEWHTAGRLTLFATPGPAELCFGDAVRMLEPAAPYLTRLVQAYAQSIAWMYGMRPHEFQEACRLHITWYAQTSHTPVSLPTASPCRYENGPIVRVGVGLPVVTHDFIPALSDPACTGQEHPIRLEVSEGIMVITDGHARMRYSHGHPNRTCTKPWFALTFFLDCTRQSLAVGYDRETRAMIMATPVRKDHVVATHDLDSVPSPRGPTGLGLDLMGVLVKDMRLRLRVAESHAIVSRHLPRPVEASAGFKSSSSMSLE